ncbi:hypothetical protein I4641_16070 [Waterburya agarophytonicola K14]|uniref:Uncharacterized protein n=1 Tax=Waterburya agarophytonicola KI4 TaxID=2874699 RepID=A0A964BSS7_9CYAN|nr:hypothetical protein [Waterburya agarophytonicola]MCC0178494.1 hypothetical protein [Waterburya agarophytonicola KI4]
MNWELVSVGRPKLERDTLRVRVDPHTPNKLKKMALELGFQWGNNGNTGKFLDAIALLSVENVKKLLENKDD